MFRQCDVSGRSGSGESFDAAYGKSKAVVDVLSPSFDSIIEKSVQNPDMKESRLFLMYLRLSESQSFEESKRLKSRINVLELALIGYASDREL